MTGAPKRTPRAHVTEARIVAEALRLIRDEPAGKFTLSRLAKRLGISTPSLYSHVPSKQYIIERVRSSVVSQIDDSVFETLPWDRALVEWGKSYAEAFARHPETIHLLATHSVQAPELIRQYERAAAALLAAGWPEDRIMHAITAVESLVLGSVLDMVAPPQMVQPGEGDFPLLHSLVDDLPSEEDRAQRSFVFGLEALVAGFASGLEADA